MTEATSTEAAASKKPKAEVVAITMQDGRTVEFAGKRKMLKSTSIEGTTVKTRLDFRNGETREFTIPDALLLQFAGHGAEQKLGDETAGEEDVDDMVLSVDALIERLNRGEWRTQREPGSSMAGTSVLLQALVELSGKSKEDVKAFLATKSQAEKAALRASDKLRPIVQRIEAEKAAKNNKVDTAGLLAELAI
jgi:hypothetical protein